MSHRELVSTLHARCLLTDPLKASSWCRTGDRGEKSYPVRSFTRACSVNPSFTNFTRPSRVISKQRVWPAKKFPSEHAPTQSSTAPEPVLSAMLCGPAYRDRLDPVANAGRRAQARGFVSKEEMS